MSDARIGELASEAWRLHRAALSAKPEVRVTRPSAPILYFGDLSAYRASPLRVVTVGVNPSGEEFPATEPWSRFALTDDAERAALGVPAIDQYLVVLNQYFQRDPYERWFNRSYEPVLTGLDASFYGTAASTALHIDICSPLATTPTWRLLQRYEQDTLAADGIPLWHRLVEELSPQVILASLSRRHLGRISYEPLAPAAVIYTVAHKRPYNVTARRVRVRHVDALLVWAGASTTPFQPITHAQKRVVGEKVHELLDA